MKKNILVSVVLFLCLTVLKPLNVDAKTNQEKLYKHIQLQMEDGSVYKDKISGELYLKNSDGSYYEAEKTVVNESNVDDVLVEIQDKEVRNDIVNFLERNGENASVEVYQPVGETQSQGGISTFSTYVSTETKKYTGFKNYKYRQVLVKYKSTSDEFGTSTWIKGWTKFVDDVFNNAVKLSYNSMANWVSGGKWSYASVFTNAIPSKYISTSNKYKSVARLIERKSIKYTYITIDGSEYFGSRTEKSKYRFQHIVKIDGYGSFTGSFSEWKTKKTKNFASPDKLAYYSYVNNTGTERVSHYKLNKYVVETTIY